jgi:hypothetical protein
LDAGEPAPHFIYTIAAMRSSSSDRRDGALLGRGRDQIVSQDRSGHGALLDVGQLVIVRFGGECAISTA